jgi:hypothetical protein
VSSAKSHLGWSVRVIRTETPAYEFESVGVLIKPRYFGLDGAAGNTQNSSEFSLKDVDTP